MGRYKIKRILTKKEHACETCGEDDPKNFYGVTKSVFKSCHNQKLIKKRRDNLKKAREMLGGKCSKCGYNKCDAALEFHHITNDKEFVIAGAKYSWKRMEPEVKKCILLCANCHREHHNFVKGTLI